VTDVYRQLSSPRISTPTLILTLYHGQVSNPLPVSQRRRHRLCPSNGRHKSTSPRSPPLVPRLTDTPHQAKKGGFKDTLPEELLSNVLKAVYTAAKLDPKLIEDVAVGNVLPPGGGATAARMAALHAGIPNSSAVYTVNRQCSSGLTAVSQIANGISAGQIDIGIGTSRLSPCAVYVLIMLQALVWRA
jgi:hypothetical protein